MKLKNFVIFEVILILLKECDGEVKLYRTKDHVKNYRNYTDQISANNATNQRPPLDDIADFTTLQQIEDADVRVQIQIPVIISLPPMTISEKDIANHFGSDVKEVLKDTIIKKLIKEFYGVLQPVNYKGLGTESIKEEELTLDTDSSTNEQSLDKTKSTSKYSRYKRSTPSGGNIFKKELTIKKFKAKEAVNNEKETWNLELEENDSNGNTRVVYPDESNPALNSNNRVSEIVIERFGTKKMFDDKPLKHFLGHRFSSLFQSRPTRGSLYNSGADNYQFPSSNSYPQSSSHSPMTFDDLELGTGIASEHSKGLEIPKRLGKLDSVFLALRLESEECRKKVLCEVAREAVRYSPLAEIVQQETTVNGNLREIGNELLDSSEGIRLLTYIEASTRGKDRYRQCDVYRHRCRQDISQLIDMDSLAVWKEVVGWLTVKVLANGMYS